jgi:SAM-dependent methyltransferase
LGLPPPPTADPQLARDLRTTLDALGYAPQAFVAAVAGVLPSDPRLATALRLLARGEEVSLEDAGAALDSAGAASLGVIRLDGEVVRPSVRIVPHDILLLASDLPATPPPSDHVAAAHDPSLTLARLTVRRPVERALDLGTGNGIQALLLAAHAKTVVATDVSERALRFTELNAALNGRTNIETRLGSWLDPVAGERFGSIVCSPPYVISPESHLLYRDAGVRGDALSERLVRELPTLLADGGFATVLVSWVPQGGDPEPLAWPPKDCSALVVPLHSEKAQAAAEYWYADRAPDEARAGVERWLDYYRRESIDAIAYGAVVVQRGGEQPWRDWVDLPGGPRGAAGAQLERIFDAHVTPTPARYAWAPGVQFAPSGETTTVSIQPGLGLAVELSVDTLEAVESGDDANAAVVSDLWSLGFLVARS